MPEKSGDNSSLAKILITDSVGLKGFCIWSDDPTFWVVYLAVPLFTEVQ